jgi:hypothetical protein
MKKLHQFFFAAALVAAVSFTSCKAKDKDENNAPSTSAAADTTMSTNPTPTPPPTISATDSLKSGVADALKDYPTIKGDVSDSIINLTGSIKRADWQKLMPTLNSLHPKRVNSSNLTIK